MHATTAELIDAGRALRARAARSAIGTGLDFDRDPVAILEAQNATRLAELVPLRWTRMAASPFTFYRGAAAVMAHDLASTPMSGVTVQAFGDAHLSNFGLYASPERALVFDLNDFDETHPGPWEWDVERLAASFAVASRQNGFGDRCAHDTAAAAARAYRETMLRAAGRSARDLFHDMVTIDDLLTRSQETAADGKVRRQRARELERTATKARRRTADQAFAKLAATGVDGELRIVQQPPLMFRPDRAPADLLEVPKHYRSSASPDVESLLHRYHAVDLALRVVGVGSVGTRCFILLCLDSTGSPLLLQAKEATASVLEPWTAASRYTHMGQRVVAGQRIMQAASDPLLGWTESEGRHVRCWSTMRRSAAASSPARTPRAASRRSSPAISATGRRSTTRSGGSRSPTPTRTSATTPHCGTRSRPAGWRRVRAER